MPVTMRHNLVAEKHVLGSIFLKEGTFHGVSELVSAPDFVREAHRMIFRAMGTLSLAGEAIDLVSVKNRLHASGDLDDAGGPAYMASLLDGVRGGLADAQFYAKVVSDTAKLRRKKAR